MDGFDDIIQSEDEFTAIERFRQNLVCGLQFGDLYIIYMSILCVIR